MSAGQFGAQHTQDNPTKSYYYHDDINTGPLFLYSVRKPSDSGSFPMETTVGFNPPTVYDRLALTLPST